MSSNTGLKNAPLRQNLEFNWVFLVELILCGVLTLFFLFYFNRVVAAVLSYGFRTWTWHKYRVFVDVQSFQVSLLAGRVFFKGFRYHGNNETIFVQSGYITWRYWLRNVRQLEISRDHLYDVSPGSERQNVNDSQKKEEKIEEISKPTTKLPCRLTVSLNGLELFIYNRSSAYDAIAQSLIRRDSEVMVSEYNCRTSKCNLKNKLKKDCTEERRSFSNSENSKSSVTENIREHPIFLPRPSETSFEESKSNDTHEKTPALVNDSIFLRLLPLRIDCEKAAIVIGNHNTKSVLVTKFEKAQGKIDAANPSSKFDLYKQLINIQFENPVIQIKPNNDYREDQTVTGSRIAGDKCDPDESKQRYVPKCSFIHRQRRKAWHILKENIPAFQGSVDSFFVPGNHKENPQSEPASYGWQGLSRYLDENEQDENNKWNSTEYALVSTIFESHSVVMDFYWDEVGTVWNQSKKSEQEQCISNTNNINGDIPPEYGINLSVRAATINYGPWADRQRVDIQKTFFPSLCKDIAPATRLAFGQTRVPTEFKLNIEFDEQSVLRIPIKEASKNWKWNKQVETMGKNQKSHKRNSKYGRKAKHDTGKLGPEARPFGWLDIRFGANSTISYRIDFIAGPLGYSSKLDVDFPTVEIMTSVNHGLLWKSINCRICCDLPTPLKWNSCRVWKFDISSKNLELFILREHVFLFTDLVDDWGSGPPPEYLTFCPFKYLVNFHFDNFKIYFNVNDSNIINNPSDFEDNTYVVFVGSVLNSNVLIPLNEYRPYHNEIPLNIIVKNGGFNLFVPPWNTQATFLVSKELATLKSLSLKARYQYCSTTSSSNVDTLLLDMDIKSLSANFYGFAIRYLFKIKDNYFGDDIQFKTLEEYQESLSSFQDKTNSQKPFKISNDLDVIMSFFVDSFNLTLPSNLYSANNNVRINISNVSSDLRFTNYYMEYNLDLSTVAFSPGYQNKFSKNLKNGTSNTELFFDGVTVFCSRLFGLPPAEPTYACNWDFSVGPVTGECTIEFIRLLISGARAFSFSFNDDENALPSIIEQHMNDVTFLRVSFESLNLWLHVEESAIFLSTMKILLNFNDWAGPRYSKKLNMVIPKLKLGCIDTESAREKSIGAYQTVQTDALIQSSLSIVMIEKNLKFEKDRLLQQEHLQRHDQRTHRSNFLLDFELLDKNTKIPAELPTMKAPPMPTPVVRNNLAKSSRVSGSNSFRSQRTDRNSSFLSQISTSTKSKFIPKALSESTEIEKAKFYSESKEKIDECRHHIPLQNIFSKNQDSSYKYVEKSYNVKSFSSPTAFSNTYVKPNFSLEGVEPDTSHLPEGFAEIKKSLSLCGKILQPEISDSNSFEEAQLQTSFMVSFTETIRGFIKPKAVFNIFNLLNALQAVDPTDLLDELQIDSINEILKAKDKSSGTVFNLGLSVPSLEFRLLNPLSSDLLQGVKNKSYDQFDISVFGLVVKSKLNTVIKSNRIPDSAESTFTAYMSISSAKLSVRERHYDMKENQPAINSALQGLVIRATFKNEPVVHLRIKSLELVTSCNQAKYIASLIYRAVSLSAIITDLISAWSKQKETRIRCLIYLIAITEQRTSEPLFLTRPSYVLRSTTGHLRTNDSWMIIARLHHMYNSFDSISQSEIASHYFNNPANAEDDRRRMISVLSRLKSWSLNDLNDCTVISKVYGKAKNTSSSSFLENNFTFSLKTESIWLVIDPGPKQNGISLSQIAINLRNIGKSPSVTTGLQEDDELTRIIVLEVFLSECSVEVNWELCRITGDVLRLYQKYQGSIDTIETPSFEEKDEISLSRKNDIHVVFAIQKTSINFDTINISGTSLIRNIEASFILTRDISGKDEIMSSFILAVDMITSKIKSHSQELISLQFHSSCLNFTYIDNDGHENSTNMLQIAGICQEICLTFNQDILVLMEVLDLVLVDEASQGFDIINTDHHNSLPETETNTRSPKKFRIPDVSIALFLSTYEIRIPLLPSLTYHMRGETARASVTARAESEIVLNFDIKDHSYNVKNSTDQHDSSMSLLKLPPTNGRIIIDMGQKDTTLSVVASVDLIKVDAAVAHTLLTTINRPEFSIMIAEVENNFKKVKAQIQDIFHPEKSKQGPIASITPITPIATKDKAKFLYNANLTLAGFKIFATASSKDNSQKTVRLDLDLGCIQLTAMNFLEPKGPILEFPELSIFSHRVMFELSRWNQKLMEPCGNVIFTASLTATSKRDELGHQSRSYHIKGNSLKINLFLDTASSVLEVWGYLQNKMKDLHLSEEKNYLRKLHESQSRITASEDRDAFNDKTVLIFKSIYSFELLDIQISWLLRACVDQLPSGVESEDLVVSLRRIVLSSRKENSSRLKIEDLQVQMVPYSQDKSFRSLNSALLPEIIFNVDHLSTENTRRLAFQASGKSLDMRLTSNFMIPASALKKSIISASEKFQQASTVWRTPVIGPVSNTQARQPFLGKKRLESLFVDADFAGAVVHLSGKSRKNSHHQISEKHSHSQAGKYGRFINNDSGNNNSNTILRSPGLAWKVEFKDNGVDSLAFNAEVKVDASSNVLYPSVVPLIMEISSTVKEIVSDEDVKEKSNDLINTDDTIITTDPTAVLGRTKLNLGLRICRQEFGLSCQPISRVAATAQFDDIYIAVNTMHSNEQGHFLAASATIHRLKASVQHVYSREATGSFDVDKIVLSLMNSKHVSSASGISAILKISPMKVVVNVKQLQDFLLFREIWIPKDTDQRPQGPLPANNHPQPILVQRYQQVAATEAFPWNATLSIAELSVQLNLGQAIGKSNFTISGLWLSSKKNSAWEQNLCIGIEKAGVECTGRMSGFVNLQNFKLRTSIQWPTHEIDIKQTPLIQASIGLSKLCAKAAFDYHAFLVADITSIHFLMYNVRTDSNVKGDRLVAILEGESVQVFSTTISASQALALYQAFQKLIQEKQANFEASLSEIEKLLNRKSASQLPSSPKDNLDIAHETKESDFPISLHTDVLVTLKAVNIGIFPNTFLDNQVLKLEAHDAEARFTVKMDDNKIHSILGLTLGQLRIGLAAVKEPQSQKSTGDISVQDVISSVIGSREGTILKVPKVQASMQTWQIPRSNHIDYIFKSSFEGKVEVGWNYSRISYIRSMWAAHLKALTQRLGKPLPPSAVRITSVPDRNDVQKKEGEQQKITAEVSVPQSKYDYTALEPPIIETPQLRDMGEATPPLEWIGLNRDKLPNLTHQIVIVALLELASEVDDAYTKILGSS